ncbi:MAG: DNA gyrase inhibitor YacG [Acidobacteria bacterium]|nr:DNA gyrase inhibitor YacG [Acidobacteriota bacterium]
MIRRCPNCRQETVWTNNPWRPFCSERCQLIDLGRWASEDYRIPLKENSEYQVPDAKNEDREVINDEQV